MPTIQVHFKLKEPKSTEPTLILLKTYFNNQRFVYSTKEKILPQLWDSLEEKPTNNKSLIKEAEKNYPLVKQQLEDIKIMLNRHCDEINRAVSYYSAQKSQINSKNLKKWLDKEFRFFQEDKEKQVLFNDVFNEFLEVSKQKYSYRTLQKYKTLHTVLKEFEENAKYSITFDTIDLVFYDKFNTYLLGKKNASGEVGLLNDTIGKYFACLKVFMQWSIDRGYHSNKTFTHKEFKVLKTAKNEIVTLTEGEFLKILQFDFSKNLKLEKVRDIFCFATFVGQRWSDIANLRKDDINDNWWVFKAQKTKKVTKIPFSGWSKPALDILKKYDFKLPLISQQKFNDYIKEVGKLAEINSIVRVKRQSGSREIVIEQPKYNYLSSHTARRTCVTILLSKGVPPTTVMKLTGHSDLSTLMKYENTKEDALLSEFERITHL